MTVQTGSDFNADDSSPATLVRKPQLPIALPEGFAAVEDSTLANFNKSGSSNSK